jgi:hypothetical protein
VEMTTYVHLVLRLRMSGAIPLLPLYYMPLCCGRGKLLMFKAKYLCRLWRQNRVAA